MDTTANTSTTGTAVSSTLPDVTRPDTGAIFSSVWLLGSPERQRAAAEAIVSGWKDGPWSPGALSYSIFLGTDGDTIRHYSQWTSIEAFEHYQRTVRDSRVSRIDETVPGIVRQDLRRYSLYRSFVAKDADQVPGIVVFPTADAETSEELRRFIDAMLDGSGIEDDATPGLLSAHFHVSTDGTRMLNYAEWTSEDAHEAALGGKTLGTASELASKNLRNPGFKRFRLFATLTPA